MEHRHTPIYPPIPEKKFFTIGDAARLAGSKPHILRHWEKELGEALANINRRGKRRYYSREDIMLLRRINTMRVRDGYTIAGIRSALNGQAREHTPAGRAESQIDFVRAELDKIIDLL